ncbi:MAG: hypothetical protein ACLQIK_14480 [Mycobacterium sp.]|uniref:hypothetical protein n=1 Tax=Mycobacterium sp. TaxID=1785 RepID=UPI003F98380F
MSRWPNTVALVPDRTKRLILAALKAGSDDEEIAEATGLDGEQVAAIRAAVSR